MKIKNVKLVVFDLDGTLINAYPAITRSFNAVMRAAGYPERSVSVIRRAVGWGDRNLLAPFVPRQTLDKVLALYRNDHKRTLVKYSRLYPGVRSMLSRLRRRGYLLAVATNRPTRFTDILLKHLDLRGYFDAVVCADKLENMKPHPQILHVVMERLRVHPEQTLYVGDMFIDAQTGSRAGVKTVMVLTGSSTARELKKEKPDKIIPAAAGLSSILP